jgi:hypothetical protein
MQPEKMVRYHSVTDCLLRLFLYTEIQVSPNAEKSEKSYSKPTFGSHSKVKSCPEGQL